MKLEEELKVKRFKHAHHSSQVNIIYTAGWLNAYMIKSMRPYGISPQQYNILRILRGRGEEPSTVSLLIERMLEKTSNASRLVEKLRTKGLVERRECPADRRQVDIVITQAGMDLLARIDREQKIDDHLVTALTDEEAQTLTTLLDKVRNAR